VFFVPKLAVRQSGLPGRGNLPLLFCRHAGVACDIASADADVGEFPVRHAGEFIIGAPVLLPVPVMANNLVKHDKAFLCFLFLDLALTFCVWLFGIVVWAGYRRVKRRQLEPKLHA
jgi:hypothetical protein